MGPGARVDIDELSSPNGSHLASPSRQNHLPHLCRCRLSADCFVQVLAGAVVDRLPHERVLMKHDLFVAAVGAARRLPRWPAAYLRGQYSSPCFSAQLALRSTRRPPSLPPAHARQSISFAYRGDAGIQSAGYILGAASRQ